MVVAGDLGAAQVFRVATFNIENYLDVRPARAPPNPAPLKPRFANASSPSNPMFIALEEVVRQCLNRIANRVEGGWPGFALLGQVAGYDTNIHVSS